MTLAIGVFPEIKLFQKLKRRIAPTFRHKFRIKGIQTVFWFQQCFDFKALSFSLLVATVTTTDTVIGKAIIEMATMAVKLVASPALVLQLALIGTISN